MEIYKVRFLNNIGEEVAEFGFYEALHDAEKRRAEVAYCTISQPGIIEIERINIIPDSEKIKENIEENTKENWCYDLKD